MSPALLPTDRSVAPRLRVVLLALMLSGALLACKGGDGSATSTGQGKLTVAVTVLPQRWLVQRIAGDRVQVEVLLPPGASPESYEPRMSQLSRLSKARLWVQVGGPGLPFETAWADKIRSVAPDLQPLDTSAGLDLLGDNPHTWLSPRRVALQAKRIAQRLIEFDPSGQAVYSSGRTRVLAEIDALDAELRRVLEPARGRRVLAFHPSWLYFVEDYGLKLVAAQHEGHEPGAHGLGELLEEARAAGLKDVFEQPQIRSHSAATLARSLGGQVRLLDPLAEDWPASLRAAARAFAEHAR